MLDSLLDVIGKKKTDYPVAEIIDRARRGRKAIYPFSNEKFRFSIYGASLYGKTKRFKTLDDLVVSPPQFTPQRLKKAIELISREPIHHDVQTKCEIGKFKVNLPLVQSSMGSQDDWNKVSIYSAQACAELGIAYGIGENITATWGYNVRNVAKQPSFCDRALSYLENVKDCIGGLVVQQNQEDAYDELWNKIYSDKRFDEYIQQGLIAFEIKGGQGAKAGMGGEKIVDRETARRLKQKYTMFPDPDEVESQYYERHSSPDIFTEEILERRIKKLHNDYPSVKVWFKTGPYRDLDKVIEIASSAGADNITIDGKEGGTGMSPGVALNDTGMPTLACIKEVRKARERGIGTSIIVSGRLYNGAHIVKAMALGANGVAMGRPFLLSCYAYFFAEHFVEHELYNNRAMRFVSTDIIKPDKRSITFVKNFVDSVEIESKLLTAAVGKYNMADLSKDDVASLDPQIAEAFGIKSVI